MTSELRSGGLIRLRLRSDGGLAWAVSAWATLCGAVASGTPLTPPDGVRLLLTLLLVDTGWGTVWGTLATTDWATPLRRWRHWHVGNPPLSLPYVRPGSPGDHLTRWFSQLWAWGKAVLAPTIGRALGAAAAGLLLSLILAAVLGPSLIALTVGALALMQLALVLDRGRGQVHAGWDSVLRVGLPWLAGHLAFAPPTLPSAALAAAFSVTVAGIGSMNQTRGRTLWAAGQLAAATLFLPLHRPLAVPLLVLLLVPQLILSAYTDDPHPWISQTWAWLAAAMLLSAWVL